MREYKFRAWQYDGDYSRMIHSVQGVLTAIRHVLGGASAPSFSDCNNQPDKDRYVLMEWTGFVDKNGVDIYEGDILRVTDQNDEVDPSDSDTGIGVVEWLEKWGFWNISYIENGLGDILDSGYVEVVGNIFENPEKVDTLG